MTKRATRPVIDDEGDRPSAGAAVTLEQHWRELVTAALLGTDRRDPPAPIGPLVDLVADTARSAPSERMLAHVAACTAVRRAGVTPAPAASPLVPPPVDDRPPCPAAATQRWYHITSSWPVLEDEWMLALTTAGWRVAPELAPAMLRRHRSDPPRRERAIAVIGPLGPWLIEHLPDLAGPPPRRGRRTGAAAGGASVAGSADALGELPELPIPPEWSAMLTATGAASGGRLAVALEAGELGSAHRAVLINLVARLRADALADFASVLDAVDPAAPGYGLAATLSDLAVTRRRMLDELAPPDRAGI